MPSPGLRIEPAEQAGDGGWMHFSNQHIDGAQVGGRFEALGGHGAAGHPGVAALPSEAAGASDPTQVGWPAPSDEVSRSLPWDAPGATRTPGDGPERWDSDAVHDAGPEQSVGDGPRPGRSRHRSSRRRRQLPLWQEAPLLLLAAFCIAVLIRTFLLQAFYIPSGSMEHTLDIGDKVLVNKVVYGVREPNRGEVVVFRGTDRWAPEHEPPPSDMPSRVGRFMGDLVGLSQPGEKDFIKRVIGVPGDTVACCDAEGRVTINGHPLDEPYIFENSPDDVPASQTECRSREFGPVSVPKGHVFVMGDHRLVSQDSRCQGPVPIENIIGRAFLVVWPTDRWDTLAPPDIFSDVPKPYAASEPSRPAVSVIDPIGALAVPTLISFTGCRGSRERRARRLSA